MVTHEGKEVGGTQAAGIVEIARHILHRVEMTGHAAGLRGAQSCRDNRGVPGSPVFQLNHWVTPPVPSHAVAANKLLASRAATCDRTRKRIPTLVAVDFADRSEVVRVARIVNKSA